MMLGSKMKSEYKNKLWAECCSTAVFLSNYLPDTLDTKTPNQRYLGRTLPLPPLRTFGELEIVKHTEKILKKSKNKGYKAMMVGYAQNSARGTYRFLKINALTIRESRNAIWLNKISDEADEIEEDENLNFPFFFQPQTVQMIQVIQKMNTLIQMQLRVQQKQTHTNQNAHQK